MDSYRPVRRPPIATILAEWHLGAMRNSWPVITALTLLGVALAPRPAWAQRSASLQAVAIVVPPSSVAGAVLVAREGGPVSLPTIRTLTVRDSVRLEIWADASASVTVTDTTSAAPGPTGPHSTVPLRRLQVTIASL